MPGEESMEINKLIQLIEIKEMQAYAYFDYYLDKMLIDDLQKELDGYCERMAESFIRNHYGDFEDSEMLVAVRRYITSFSANKAHSGKRFHEALYKALKQFDSISKEKE